MSRVGQVWESITEGLHIVVCVELYKGVSMTTMLGVDRGNVGYLPEYVLAACEKDEDLTWRRLA
jgi:hypothetical protein